jgi:osmotically-inducible protein OsmY
MYRAALACAVAIALLLEGCASTAASAGAVTQDRRTSGTIVEDQDIEKKARRAISQKYDADKRVHANVTCFNRYVLLTGEVPDEATKRDVGVIALGIENVRNVQNELVVGPAVSRSQRRSDGYTTMRVNTRFAREAHFPPSNVKVTTDDGVVYLMGLVSRKEADEATEIARTTSGVSKVVRVFELMD